MRLFDEQHNAGSLLNFSGREGWGRCHVVIYELVSENPATYCCAQFTVKLWKNVELYETVLRSKNNIIFLQHV